MMEEMRSGDADKEMDQYLLGAQNVKLRDRILLSPYTKFLLPSLVIAFVVPVIVYIFMVSPYVVDSSFSLATCNLRLEYYVECFPGQNVSESECAENLCCWNDILNFCYHTVPSRHGYTPDGGIYYEGAALTPRRSQSPLGSPNVEKIYAHVTSEDGNHVEISLSTRNDELSRGRRRRGSRSILYKSSSSGRSFEADEDFVGEDEVTQRLLYFLPRDSRRRTVEIELGDSSNLNAYVHYPEFSVTVARKNFFTNEESLVFSTARGPLILTETYWEWTLYLTNGSLYGLNDLEVNGTTNAIYGNENGTITPAFLAITPSGEGAAYYVDYEGPLEVQVLNVSNLVILRGLSMPENLVVHVFAGPTPLEAVQQLTLALSSRSESPASISPSFNFGLHVCPKENFTSVNEAFAELNETIESMATLEAPWDSHCLHERVASVLNHFLTADDLATVELAKNLLAESGRSFSPHLSPMVLQNQGTLYSGLENSELLLTNLSTPHVGLYQELDVVYPDWANDSVKTMATSYLTDYLNDVGSPESVWLRDSWPKDELNSSLKSGVSFAVFDYIPRTLEYAMNNLTVPYDLQTTSGASHHRTHNSYSRGFRNFIRSSIPTVEFFAPPGEAGNTTWSGLRRSIRSGVGAGIVGQLPPPNYVCGTGEFDNSIHDELCIRWYQAAVTWPYIIVLPDRFPGGSFLSTSASLTAARSLRLRASLATYQRTVNARFFIRGAPVLAPTSFYYPKDTLSTHSWDQFMWGEAMLVGLVSLPGVSQVQIRLPGYISWRHLKGGSEVRPIINGTVPVTANIGELITLVRPGHLVVIHKEIGNTTEETISNEITLAVNLNCDNENEKEEKDEERESSCVASGEIYYGFENGDFLTIQVNASYLILGNLKSVKNYACDNNNNKNSASYRQATFIETVQLLGTSSHKVDTELCDLAENNIELSLTRLA